MGDLVLVILVKMSDAGFFSPQLSSDLVCGLQIHVCPSTEIICCSLLLHLVT